MRSRLQKQFQVRWMWGLVLVAILLWRPGLCQESRSIDAVMTDLAAELAERFPPVAGEVIKVDGARLYLSLGAQDNIMQGMQLTLFREGEPLKPAGTGEALRRLETEMGLVTVGHVAERYAVATLTHPTGKLEARSGDRVRITSGQIVLGVLPLINQTSRPVPSEALAEALHRALTETDRFRPVTQDRIALWLLKRGMDPEARISPDVYPEMAQSLQMSYVLLPQVNVLRDTAILELQLLFPAQAQIPLATVSALLPDMTQALRSTEMPLPQVAQPPPPAPQSIQPSGQRRAGLFKAPPQRLPEAKPWNLADTLTEIQRIPELLIGMDGKDMDHDGLVEVATATESRVSLYQLEGERLVLIDTFTPRQSGRLLSVQLLRLGEHNTIGLVVNRQTADLLMDSFILTLEGRRLVLWQEHLYDILLAMDTDGDGINDSVWGQPLDEEQFFRKGRARQLRPANGALQRHDRLTVPSSFRATGAALVRLHAEGPRHLVFVDQLSRLRVYRDDEEVWRSPGKVGGSYTYGEVVPETAQGVPIKQTVFFEPLPVPVDIDGDGIEEVLLPRNASMLGFMPGLNLYSGGEVVMLREESYGLTVSPISPQFNGIISGLVALSQHPPSVLMALSELKGALKHGGTTTIFLSRMP